MSPAVLQSAEFLIREKNYWKSVINKAAALYVTDRAVLAQKMFDRWSDVDSDMAVACRAAASEVILEEMEGLDLAR